MSSSSTNSFAGQRRIESLQRRGRISRRTSTAYKPTVSRYDAYTFALRVAYLSHLLQPKARRLQHASATPRPNLSRTTTSVADLLKDFSAVRDAKSTRFPSAFMQELDKRITAVLMGKEKMLEFNDALVKRSFAAFLNEFKKPEFRKSMEKDRRAEDLMLIFFSNATKELQKGKAPTDDSWRLLADRHVALFVRLLSSTLKTNDWAKEKPELSSRLQTMERKLLRHDQDLVDGSQRNGGAGGTTTEVEVPRSQQVKDMPLVLTVADMFGKSLPQIQSDIDDQKDLWTEKAALLDLKMYQTNLNLNTRKTLRADDFDTDDAYETWKKSEAQELSQMMLAIIQSNPELAQSTAGAAPQVRTSNGVGNGTDYNHTSRTLSMGSEPTSPYVIDQPVDMSGLNLGWFENEDHAPDDGEQYMFIPPDPRAYYRALVGEAVFYGVHNDAAQDVDNPESRVLAKRLSDLLGEVGNRWRVPYSSRLVLFLDVVKQKYIEGEVNLEVLSSAFTDFKDPTLDKKKPISLEQLFDRTKWPLADYVLNQQVLTSVHEALLRDLFEQLGHCYDTKPPDIAPIMEILEAHIYDDSLFSKTPQDLDRFGDRLQAALQGKALDHYNALFVKEIGQLGEKAEFFHVIQLGKTVLKLMERIQKRYRKTPQIMGVEPYAILVDVVLPAYTADTRGQISTIIERATQRGEEIADQDGFELYKELVAIRRSFASLLPNSPFDFSVEELLQGFVWHWIASTDEKITTWVDEAIKQDTFLINPEHTGSGDARHSVSVLDIFQSFKGAVEQILALDWDNDLHYAKFMTALSKSIGTGLTRYCEQLEQIFIKEMERLSAEQEASIMVSRQDKWIRMAKDALATKEKIEPFQFLPESLVKLNNIEYAMLQLDLLEKEMNADACAEVIRNNEPPTPPRRKDEKYLFTVKIIEAEELRACDMNGLSDPYVVLVDELQKRLAKTRIIYGNLNPRWDETVDIMTKGPVNLIATIWDWDQLGDHDCVGRTAIKLDPIAFKDFLPREYWLDLDTQGRLLVRVSMEGEKDDIQFYFGKTFRALKRTVRDMTRKITDKLSAYIQQCLSRRTLRSLTTKSITSSLSNSLTTKNITSSLSNISSLSNYMQRVRPQSVVQGPSDMEIENALKPLFGYFNENFAIMNQTLTSEAMVTVMARLWKETLSTIESLLVPPLSDKPSSQKQLTPQELEIVFKWLRMLFDFFHAIDEQTGHSEGVPLDVLRSPKYQDIMNLNFFYNESTEDLIKTSERMALTTADRQRQAQARVNRFSAPALMVPAHSIGGSKGLISYPSTRRSKSIMLSRNLGTMKKAKEEKRKEAQAEASDDMIMRILRMRPEAERYLRERARQKERLAAVAAAEMIVRQSLGTPEARQLLSRYPGGADNYLRGL